MRVLADAMGQQQFNSVDDEGYIEEEEKWLTVLTAIQNDANHGDIKNVVLFFKQYQRKSTIPRYEFGEEFFPLTPLKYSIMAGNYHMFLLFILYGQDIDEHVNEYESLAKLAFVHRQHNIVNLLLSMRNNNIQF